MDHGERTRFPNEPSAGRADRCLSGVGGCAADSFIGPSGTVGLQRPAYGYPKGFPSLSEIVLHCTRKSGLGLPWVWNWTPRKSAWEAAAVLATLWRRIDGVRPIGHGLLIWISSPYRNDCSRDSGGTSRAGAATMTMAKPCQGSEQEERYWPANRKEVPRCIEKGFLDSWRVPNRTPYPVFSNTNKRLAGLKTKLRETDPGPKPPGTLTLRCYRDWRSYERQVTLNLKYAVDWNRNRA